MSHVEAGQSKLSEPKAGLVTYAGRVAQQTEPSTAEMSDPLKILDPGQRLGTILRLPQLDIKPPRLAVPPPEFTKEPKRGYFSHRRGVFVVIGPSEV